MYQADTPSGPPIDRDYSFRVDHELVPGRGAKPLGVPSGLETVFEELYL